jgi:hypothetical protein
MLAGHTTAVLRRPDSRSHQIPRVHVRSMFQRTEEEFSDGESA